MRRWWLTLGDFEDHAGLVLELRWNGSTLSTREVIRYRVPEPRRVHGKGFTGAARVAHGLIVCGFNALYAIDLAGAGIAELLARADFNDLHHIAVHQGRLWVANTGLDRIDIFEQNGRFAGSYSLVPGAEECDRQTAPAPVDNTYFTHTNASLPFYRRRVADRVHPNHVSFDRDRILVTCFAERCVQDIRTFTPVVLDTPGYPHDAHVCDDLLWLTCTNGLVIAYAIDGDHYRETIRLDVFASTGHTGWCRGLWVGTEHLLVGLTRITRMPRYRWCDRPFAGTETSVLLLERRTGELVAHADLSPFGAHPKLFGVVADEDAP